MTLRAVLSGWRATACALAAAACAMSSATAGDAAPGMLALSSCWLVGVEHAAACGVLRRPLDPAAPGDGRSIDIHVAVLPALARNKLPDPVFYFAGGPGQSAIALAGQVQALLARLTNRRDIVLIDQRGTGRSAPLACGDDDPALPLAEVADPARQLVRWQRCRTALERLPHGDLRLYTTSIAVQDADAVRRALGAAKIDLVAGSYGTRVALDYMRQFPKAVRRAVLDGVAPPDMVLPASFSLDAQAAFDALVAACERDVAGCARAFPQLRRDWQALLAGLPHRVTLRHPVTGADESLTLHRDALLGLVRLPLYAPSLAAALPQAVTDAAAGRYEALAGLASALGSSASRRGGVATGMHYAVICAEDAPRVAQAADRSGADFGDAFASVYRQACAGMPAATVPAAFYTLPPAPAPTLLLSGGADPATPPRHAERVARALGAKARHVVVVEAGHGLMALGCIRDVVFRFIDAETDAAAERVDADCARTLPRPPAFQRPRPVAPGAPNGALR